MGLWRRRFSFGTQIQQRQVDDPATGNTSSSAINSM